MPSPYKPPVHHLSSSHTSTVGSRSRSKPMGSFNAHGPVSSDTKEAPRVTAIRDAPSHLLPHSEHSYASRGTVSQASWLICSEHPFLQLQAREIEISGQDVFLQLLWCRHPCVCTRLHTPGLHATPLALRVLSRAHTKQSAHVHHSHHATYYYRLTTLPSFFFPE